MAHRRQLAPNPSTPVTPTATTPPVSANDPSPTTAASGNDGSERLASSAPTPQPAINISGATLSAPSTPPPSTPPPEYDQDLVNRIRSLTPEQRARIRSAGGIGGIATGAGRPLPDGSVQVVVTVNADNVEQIRTWAEEAGKNFEEQVRELFDYLLSGYLHGEWSAPVEGQQAAAGAAKA